MLVLPGIEVTTADGHLVALFDPDQVLELEDFARPASLELITLADRSERSRRSMADLINDVAQRGGLTILAHVDTDVTGSRPNPASINDILSQPGLTAIEYIDQTNVHWFSDADPDNVRRQAWVNRTRALGENGRLARVMSSDAHDPALVGLDEPRKVLTRLRLDELNFVAVRNALAHYPDARCRLEVELPPAYSQLVSARFEGGFLDGVSIDFSPNLTCIIGGRGSGKSTALRAITYALGADIDDEIDGHDNMPDYTEVKFIDALGSERVAGRRRLGRPFDIEDEDAAIALDFKDIEQNAGPELQSEDSNQPTKTAVFLDQFVDFSDVIVMEAAASTALAENAAAIQRTSGATEALQKLRKERTELERSLEVATKANLLKVADFAQALAKEMPFREHLEHQLDATTRPSFSAVPELDREAALYRVDLSKRPAADHVPGADGIRSRLRNYAKRVAEIQGTASTELATALAPVLASLASWAKTQASWEERIDERRAELKKAGLELQVRQLDSIRSRLAAIESEERRFTKSQTDFRAERQRRKQLLADLRQTRERRRMLRSAEADRLLRALSRPGAARVSVAWRPEGMRGEWAEWLGRVFNLRTPRKERLATIVSPGGLAEIVWKGKPESLMAIGKPGEAFVESLTEARRIHEELFTYDALFELECRELPDKPEIFVHWPGEPPGRGRPLHDLSLGQARSVLLGFVLASTDNAPLILDQPEDHLDGPFIAETVVGYLHGAKERRQVIIATHSANLTVLGDAELVIPFFARGGRAETEDAGAVDAERTREQVLRLLEGGREAYRQRGQRYGLRFTT
jgi:energy-coupling factor transporter ATP-binding protein EcfA2